ncbi:hypothetical protein LR090_00165 [Candidatus Bipolaricaulota bacterium]|nr:hypothetical protein [Candidatus Bipolaricaulota bacterium]
MSAERCPLCGQRLGERRCPALDALICSTCCGTHRGKALGCPTGCTYLVAAERRRRERKARELAQAWQEYEEALARRGMEGLLPHLEVLKYALAQLLHRYPFQDADVAAALGYLARRLSPIELVEPYVPKLGELLERGLLPLVREGRLHPQGLREACEGLAAFLDHFSRKEPDRFVTALLGTYPPEEPEDSGIILRP